MQLGEIKMVNLELSVKAHVIVNDAVDSLVLFKNTILISVDNVFENKLLK
jgi:hypothetical protein